MIIFNSDIDELVLEDPLFAVFGLKPVLELSSGGENETDEWRRWAVRSALELRMILDSNKVGMIRDFHNLLSRASVVLANKLQTSLAGNLLHNVRINFVAMTMTLSNSHRIRVLGLKMLVELESDALVSLKDRLS